MFQALLFTQFQSSASYGGGYIYNLCVVWADVPKRVLAVIHLSIRPILRISKGLALARLQICMKGVFCSSGGMLIHMYLFGALH